MPQVPHPETPVDLPAFLDGELPGPEAGWVRRRVLDDPATRREARALVEAWGLLDELDRPAPGPRWADKTAELIAATVVDLEVLSPSRRRHPVVLRLGWCLLAGTAAISGFALSRIGDDPAVPPSAETLRLGEHLADYRAVGDLETARALVPLFRSEAP